MKKFLLAILFVIIQMTVRDMGPATAAGKIVIDKIISGEL